MKKKYLVILSPLIAFICYLSLSSSSGGVTGVSTTGCGGGCHGTSATPATDVTIAGLPPAGYVNGVVYPVTVTVTNTSVIPSTFGLRAGFNMSVTGGTLAAGIGTAILGTTQIRHNGVQAAPGGTKSWTFNWTAPASGSTNVTFFIAGNLANGDGSNNALDKWKTVSQILIKAPSPLSVTAASTPAILCNGGTTNINATAMNGTPAYQYKLNTGLYQGSASFTGVLAGTYTVTAQDAMLATATTVLTITQPALITFNAASITVPLCNGGVGTASITATGGTGTKTYTITPLGPQTNTTGNFTGLTAQIYTVTVSDANLCTKTTTITVTQPTLLTFTAVNITAPLCNGGVGTASMMAAGGTGTKTYTIAPLGPQTNNTGNFTGLTAQMYTVTVSDANLCTHAITIVMTEPSPITVTSTNVSGCQGSPVTLVGSPIGGTFSLPNPYTGASTTYTYSYTDGTGCSNTSSPASISITPVSPSNIVMPASSSFCETLTQVSGTNIYSNSSCQLITNITASGLGTTNACVNFLGGTPTYNSEAYANRVYSITPTTQPTSTATVCLYYTLADLAAAGITVNSDISITKVGGNGVLGGPGSVEEIINTSMTINNLSGGDKEVCFPVTSFSSFYLHSKNPNNIPLNVTLKDFRVEALPKSDLISWRTGCEINHAYFNVQYSSNGVDFSTIGKVESKSNGPAEVCDLDYNFSHLSSKAGYNFYRLEMLDINGKPGYSKTISLYRNVDENQIQVYPNPSNGEFVIQSTLPVNFSITDVNGKQVYELKKSTFSKVHLKISGIYFIKMIDDAGNISVKKLIVD